MAYGLIQDTTLQDLASALREQLGETRPEPVIDDHFTYNTTNMTSFDSAITVVASGLPETTFTVPDAVKMVVKYCTSFESGTAPIDFYINGVSYRSYERVTKEEIIEGNSVTLKAGSTSSASRNGVYSEIYAYDANDNKLIFDTGTTAEVPNTFTPTEMADTIRGINIVPEEAFVITGNCAYRFANGGWDWLVNNLKNKLRTDGISSADHMFYNAAKIVEIPFDINLTTISNGAAAGYMFEGTNLKSVPYVKGKVSGVYNLFGSCHYLRSIPEDWADNIDWSYINTYSYATVSSVFNNCYSLRRVPESLLSKLWGVGTSGSYVPYGSMFSYCYVLDEVKEIAVHQGTITSNRASSFVSNCCRLKSLTFETNADGSPKTASWKAQTLDFSNYTGYGSGDFYITSYNSGITTDKKVTDDASYQALKNDPDWWTTDVAYCRYNHDSAVETINSLPDTSAYGTNTIKFKKTAGSKTDGGAIENLTAEEIAVAAAKGWTVTLA